LIEVRPENAALLGNVGEVELEAIDDRDFRITRLGDKSAGTFAMEGSTPTLRGCARYALDPAFYDALEATGPPPAGEWDDVPAFQRLVSGDGLVGHKLEGRHFDVGQKGGYLAAMSYLFERDISGSGA
jgi:UTP--glucose-1-phosphate uridylyltransferase